MNLNNQTDPQKEQGIPDYKNQDTDAVTSGASKKVTADETAEHYVVGNGPRPPRRVTLVAAVSAMITAVLLSVLATYSLTVRYYTKDPVIAVKPGETAETTFASELDVIDRLFRSLTVYDLDEEALLTAVLKAYVQETGDEYAQYYTKQEYAAQLDEQNGRFYGIGVSVIKETSGEGDAAKDAIRIMDVYENSPAAEAGVQIDDRIIRIGSGADEVAVADIGYEKASQLIRGEEGTQVTFTVLRGDQELQMTATRQAMEAKSVQFHVYADDSTVGIVRITGFDTPTAEQFRQAMDSLIASGCTSFVVDLRYNPGGLLTSVMDIATFFLKEGDTILHTRSRAQIDKEEKTTYAITVKGDTVTSGSGKLATSDVGRYAGYPLVVLTNENTASAAELFTANVRDHKLGTIVGTKTFGKGIMQTTYPLSRYGYEGALKLTTQFYDPPTGENYQGKGIQPDVECELADEVKDINFNLLTDANDNQLRRAVEALRS